MSEFSPTEEEFPACPACGNPIDYCPGHGLMGDPAGWRTLRFHDSGHHSFCHPTAECNIHIPTNQEQPVDSNDSKAIEESKARHPAGKRRSGIVAAITFEDGRTIEPTPEGVRSIEHLVSQGWSLAAATLHVAGGPRIVRSVR